MTDTKAFREFVSHIQAVAERLEDIAGHGCVYVHEPCDKEWPGEQFKWCGACLSKVLLAELADVEPMQTSHLAPKIREERDRFRIEHISAQFKKIEEGFARARGRA
ncbi:MAG TPA: hypothetical protein VFH56_08275 [Acidimicrobiales bacterium]|nr:hypothetical protein [Acidimicrobiales bacterium]